MLVNVGRKRLDLVTNIGPVPKEGGGVPPCVVGCIGMCHVIGLGFGAVLVWKRVYSLPILAWNRVWFSRELRERMNVSVSFQFQMRKKEREIFEFEMDLKIFFVSLWTGSLFGKKKQRGKGRERGKRALFAFPSPQFPARPKACSWAIFFFFVL